MGNNAAYAAIETAAIALYDQGKLDLAALDALCEPWRGCDVDHGGSLDLQTKDGKTLEMLIVELAGEPDDPRSWEEDEDRFGDAIYRITRARWQWW